MNEEEPIDRMNQQPAEAEDQQHSEYDSSSDSDFSDDDDEVSTDQLSENPLVPLSAKSVKARQQLRLLDDQLCQLKTRLRRAHKANNYIYINQLQMKIVSIKEVRSMFMEYAIRQWHKDAEVAWAERQRTRQQAEMAQWQERNNQQPQEWNGEIDRVMRLFKCF